MNTSPNPFQASNPLTVDANDLATPLAKKLRTWLQREIEEARDSLEEADSPEVRGGLRKMRALLQPLVKKE